MARITKKTTIRMANGQLTQTRVQTADGKIVELVRKNGKTTLRICAKPTTREAK